MHLAHNRAPRARLLLLDIVAPLCAIPALLAQFVDFLSRTVLTPAEKNSIITSIKVRIGNILFSCWILGPVLE